MSTAKASQQAVGSAPAARPITEAWRLDKGTCALYTQDPAVKNLAQKAGLRWMGEYYRPDGKGVMRLVAWQFAGPKEKVMRVMAAVKRLGNAAAKTKEVAEKQAAGTGGALRYVRFLRPGLHRAGKEAEVLPGLRARSRAQAEKGVARGQGQHSLRGSREPLVDVFDHFLPVRKTLCFKALQPAIFWQKWIPSRKRRSWGVPTPQFWAQG